MAYAVNTQILERREVRRWKKALKAEPGLMLCGKRILQHCDRLAILLLLNVFPIVCYATYLSFWEDTISFLCRQTSVNREVLILYRPLATKTQASAKQSGPLVLVSLKVMIIFWTFHKTLTISMRLMHHGLFRSRQRFETASTACWKAKRPKPIENLAERRLTNDDGSRTKKTIDPKSTLIVIFPLNPPLSQPYPRQLKGILHPSVDTPTMYWPYVVIKIN